MGIMYVLEHALNTQTVCNFYLASTFYMHGGFRSARCNSLGPSQASSEHAPHSGHARGLLNSQGYEGASQTFIPRAFHCPAFPPKCCLLFIQLLSLASGGSSK